MKTYLWNLFGTHICTVEYHWPHHSCKLLHSDMGIDDRDPGVDKKGQWIQDDICINTLELIISQFPMCWSFCLYNTLERLDTCFAHSPMNLSPGMICDLVFTA